MKSNRGITLISLVITIIIMIILAGVTINMLLGQNGIFVKAKQAKEEYINEQDREKMALENYSNEIDKKIASTRSDSGYSITKLGEVQGGYKNTKIEFNAMLYDEIYVHIKEDNSNYVLPYNIPTAVLTDTAIQFTLGGAYYDSGHWSSVGISKKGIEFVVEKHDGTDKESTVTAYGIKF